MIFLILKKSPDKKHTLVVNDSEGIPLEFETEDAARRMADIFTANTTHNSTYTVKRIS